MSKRNDNFDEIDLKNKHTGPEANRTAGKTEVAESHRRVIEDDDFNDRQDGNINLKPKENQESQEQESTGTVLDSELKAKAKELIRSADLETITLRDIFKQLSAHFGGVDLSSKTPLLTAYIRSVVVYLF
jgi:hypothetical protein